MKLKVFYRCNGKCECRYSGTCSFNTGDPKDCCLTSSSNFADSNQSVFIVHGLLTVLEDVKRVFDIEIDKDNIILTEKEIKDAKGIQFHD
jgi:hypothetical protein